MQRSIFIGVIVFLFLLIHTPKIYAATTPTPGATDWGNCVEKVTDKLGNTTEVATLQCFEPVFARIITFAGAFALLAFFIMFIVSSFKFLTSGGDPKQTESAKSTMTFAFVGMVVIVSPYIIIRLLTAFTGVDLTKFAIPKEVP